MSERLPLMVLGGLRGNGPVCGGGARTGRVQVVFEAPRGVRPRRLAVWNPVEGDLLGDSRLIFDLRG